MSARVSVVFAVLLCWVRPDVSEAMPLEHGSTPTAQPGVLRVLSAPPATAGSWLLTTTGVYAWSPDVIVGDDRYQSGRALLALGYSPWSFLTIALSTILASDSYESPTGESVAVGVMGDIRLSLRTGWDLGRGFSLGALAEVWFPAGSGAFQVAGSAISPTIQTLFGFTPERVPLGVHLNLGYRYDGSYKILEDPTRLSEPQLFLSGVTMAAHHLLVSLAVEYRFGPVAPLLEISSDIPLGGGEGARSSAVLGVGAKVWLGPGDAVQLLAALEIRLTEGATPPDPSTGEVWSAPPLLGVHIGAAFRLPVEEARLDEEEPEDEPETDVEPTPVEQPQRGRIRGRLTCDEQVCAPGAAVRIEGSGFSPLAPDTETGEFTTGELPAGSYTLHATAPGFEPRSTPALVTAAGELNVELALARSAAAERPGLRGQVVDFDGQPVQAGIQIPALGVELQTDEEGRFQTDAEPGRWDVVITARGYRTQHTRVEVTQEGVVIMNIEMRRRR